MCIRDRAYAISSPSFVLGHLRSAVKSSAPRSNASLLMLAAAISYAFPMPNVVSNSGISFMDPDWSPFFSSMTVSYTHLDVYKRQIMTTMKRSQALKLRNYIRTIEPTAFMLISNSSEIIGKGFLTG